MPARTDPAEREEFHLTLISLNLLLTFSPGAIYAWSAFFCSPWLILFQAIILHILEEL